VYGEHTYSQAGSFTPHVTVHGYGDYREITSGDTSTGVTGSAEGRQRRHDPMFGDELGIGLAEVTADTGAVRLRHELDFDLSPGTSVGRDPALVYNSSTVNVRPLVETELRTPVETPLPFAVEAQLFWGWGEEAQEPVLFLPLGHPAGS